ncbi:MAG: hypothetical protein NC182_01535 [Prevotella sp.]|nr:hypothetical protein [Staphylococcus sp.]MCM1349864.1 hypothetical protein [Prevotella sp.]
MTRKMVNVIYRNNKLGNISIDSKIISRLYTEADSDMTYANAYMSELQRDQKKEIESQIMENLINGNYLVAEELINNEYSWVLKK